MKCDHVIFSFHNCPESVYRDSIKILNDIFPSIKLIILRFDDCSYLSCFRNILQLIRDLKCTDILQIQDDQHGINSNENIHNLHHIDDVVEEYKKRKDISHIHLFSDESIPKPNLQPIESITMNTTLEIYKYNSMDFKHYNIYAWNDGVYIINVSLLDELLHQCPNSDVWKIELFLHLFSFKTPILKYYI